jgi:hypothetical protein
MQYRQRLLPPRRTKYLCVASVNLPAKPHGFPRILCNASQDLLAKPDVHRRRLVVSPVYLRSAASSVCSARLLSIRTSFSALGRGHSRERWLDVYWACAARRGAPGTATATGSPALAAADACSLCPGRSVRRSLSVRTVKIWLMRVRKVPQVLLKLHWRRSHTGVFANGRRTAAPCGASRCVNRRFATVTRRTLTIAPPPAMSPHLITVGRERRATRACAVRRLTASRLTCHGDAVRQLPRRTIVRRQSGRCRHQHYVQLKAP